MVNGVYGQIFENLNLELSITACGHGELDYSF